MHISTPSWGTTRNRSDSNSLATTKQRIQRQLAAVIELSEHNADYLESFERLWIEHIISEAVSVTVDPQDSADSFSLQPDRANETASGLRDRMSAPELKPRSRSPARVAAQDDINVLLATSKSLNAANSLLSCCYDRWSWLQLSRAKRNSSQTNIDDLKELLGRRRQQQRHPNNVLSQLLEDAQPPGHNDINSTTSSRVATSTDDGSENSLFLMVDDTIEKWSKNAEDALNETTARMQGVVNSSHESPVEQHSPVPYGCRPCMTECETPLFMPGNESNAATPVATYATTRICTHRLSMPSSRPRTKHSVPDHMGATVACYECYSQTTSPQSQQFEAYRAVRPAFQPTLHNSFGKETINAIPQITNDVLPTSPPMTPPMHSSSCRHSCSTTTSQISPMVPQTTLVSAESRTSIPPGPGANGTTIFTQPKNSSTISVLSKTSGSEQTPRSRGRRWLEQHADGLPPRPDFARKSVF